MLGSVCQQLYTMVDTAIVGQFLGVDALASLGAAVCFLQGNARGKRLPFVPFLWAAWSLGMLARLAGL